MRRLFYVGILAIALVSCSKQNTSAPAAPPNNPTQGNTSQPPVNDVPKVSVYLNGSPMEVTSIKYDRSESTYNFTAENKLQKLEVNCFWFHQSSRWNYQFSDSINYSNRTDTLSAWNTTRAFNWGYVDFYCCYAPLTDPLVEGGFTATFLIGKDQLNANGNFHLIYK